MFFNLEKIYYISIIYNMPAKINMIISNGNQMFPQVRSMSQPTLESVQVQSQGVRAPSSLNAPIISRIHNVRPGCGSCGRK